MVEQPHIDSAKVRGIKMYNFIAIRAEFGVCNKLF